MSFDATVTIVGTMTRDIELKYTPNGTAVGEFSLAVNERKKEGNQWVNGDSSFFDVTVWDQMAENCAESFGKGSRVIVFGTLKQESWETKDGQKRSKIKVTASEVGPSVRWATAPVAKNERSTRSAGTGGRPGYAQSEEDPFD
jgi:single-strand DNA-binding protein